MSRYTRFSSVGSLCVTFSDWETMGVPSRFSCVRSLCVLSEGDNCSAIRGFPVKVCVLLSVTGRQWVRFSSRY